MTPAQARAMYRRQIAANGESVTISRQGRAGVTIRGRWLNHAAGTLMAGVHDNDRVLLVMAEDLAGWETGSPQTNDRIAWAGKELVVRDADDTRRRVSGELIAFEITADGA